MTRKAILISALCLATAAAAMAQNKFQQELSIGASFGATFSSVSFNPKVYTKMKQGYSGGLALRWNTGKHLGLQTELNFSQQGWAEEFEEHPTYKYTRTVNYLEVPFLTHIHFGSKRFRFYVNLGPKLGYAVGEKTDLGAGEEPLNAGANEQHNMDIEKRFDWGLCGGPGLELRTGIGCFMIEGRYNYALGDIFGNRKSDYFSKSSAQVLSARIIYLLPIIK